MKKRIPPSRRRSAADPNESIGRATCFLVAGLRQIGRTDEEIRAEVNKAILDAMEGDEPWVTTLDDPDLGEVEQTFVSAAGTYRMVFDHFGIDRSNQFDQERWLSIVRAYLEQALRPAS